MDNSLNITLSVYNLPLINENNKHPIIKFDTIEEQKCFIDSLQPSNTETDDLFINFHKLRNLKIPYFFCNVKDLVNYDKLVHNYYLLEDNLTQLQEANIDNNTNERDIFSYIIHHLYKNNIVFK
jgi:hypothetical protein